MLAHLKTFTFPQVLKNQKSLDMVHFQGKAGSQASHFMKIARAIGTDITKTYTKLEKLTLLAKYDFFFSTLSNEIFSFSSIFGQLIVSRLM